MWLFFVFFFFFFFFFVFVFFFFFFFFLFFFFVVVDVVVVLFFLFFFISDVFNNYNLWSCQKVFDALINFFDNIFIRFGTKPYRQTIGIPMGN